MKKLSSKDLNWTIDGRTETAKLPHSAGFFVRHVRGSDWYYLQHEEDVLHLRCWRSLVGVVRFVNSFAKYKNVTLESYHQQLTRTYRGMKKKEKGGN